MLGILLRGVLGGDGEKESGACVGELREAYETK